MDSRLGASTTCLRRNDGGGRSKRLALGLIVWGEQARLLIVWFLGGGASGHAIGVRDRRTFSTFSIVRLARRE